MMASWRATKYVLSSDLENVGQGHNLQKLPYLSYYMTDLYQSFFLNDATRSATKMSADPEIVGQGYHLQ